MFQGPKSIHASVRIVFLLGLPSASELKSILQSAASPMTEFIVVEPSVQNFEKWKADSLHSEFLKSNRIFFWALSSSDEFFATAYEFLRVPSRLFYMSSALFIYSSDAEAAAQLSLHERRDYFDRIRDEWKACYLQRIRSLGGIEDSRIGFQNCILNRKFIEKSPGINRLQGVFEGHSAVVVATGPSLRKSLSDLKKIQNRAILIAADASLKILHDEGIEPHFVCSIERDSGPKVFFEHTSTDRTNLVAYPLVPPNVLDAFRGRRWVAYRDYGYFFLLERELSRGVLSSSSSVAHMCLRFAFYLGARRVALVGQDLAYDPETLQSHPEGIAVSEWASARNLSEIREKAKAENLGDVFYVEGNRAKEVPTNSVYFSFMKEFSWEAQQFSGSIVNCTEGGAKIPNISWMPFKTWGAELGDEYEFFKKIDERCILDSSDRLSFREIIPFIQELRTKWIELSKVLEQVEVEANHSQQIELFKVLRTAELKMLEDTRYISIVVQNAGREYLETVNDIALLEAQESFDEGRYAMAVKRLYEVVRIVLDGLLSCVR